MPPVSAGPKPLPTRSRRTTQPAGGRVVDAFGTVGDRRLRNVPLDQIEPNPDQPRKHFDAAKLELLAGSLSARGLLQPVLVRPLAGDRYELIAGERRWRAAHLAGLSHLAAFIRSDTDDGAALELALIENAARQDLSVVEEARTLSVLLDDLEVTQQVLAQRVGRSRPDLANTVRLLELPESVLDLLDSSVLSKGHGKALLTEPDPDRRLQLARDAVAHAWSVRTLERTIARAQGPDERRRPVPSDHAAAGQRLADALSGRVDAPVKVKPHGTGFRIEFAVHDRAHAETIVARFGELRKT